MIQGVMNLVWTTRVPFLQVVRDQVFCDGAAIEGIASADTQATAASELRTHEPRFASSETDEACSGAAEADRTGSTRCRR